MSTLPAVPRAPQPSRIPSHCCPFEYESDDGWAVGFYLAGTDGGPGLRGGDPIIGETEGPWLVDEDAWRLAHPTVDPTPTALRAAFEAAIEDVLASGEAQAERWGVC